REQVAARRQLAPFGIDVDAGAPLRQLSAAQRTIVAIARALRGGVSGSGVLILDEPTATLPEHEVQLLFAAVRSVCAEGTAVLYVTHRLGEVFALADTVTVLRDGVKVVTTTVADIDSEQLITHIAGRPLAQLYPPPPQPETAIALEATNICGTDLAGVSLRLRRGEILGIAGISGSGRDELNQLLFGSTPPQAGSVTVGGHTYRALSPKTAIGAGLAYLPADRRSLSAIPVHTVRENVTLPRLGRQSLSWLGARSEGHDVAAWLRRLAVVPAEPERPFATLSGGNQQKTVLARWLRCGSRILLLDEPTQGVDVGGKRAIYDVLGAAARDGAAVIMASSDVEELAEVCDRVLVLRDGRAAAELSGRGLSAEAITAQTLTEGGDAA
nr:sugar ABC transporter ATP-binding protein [Actinomycetota bacterium]